MDDLRLGDLVQILEKNAEIPENIDIGIVGFPHDEGVRRNGGRVGAKEGPKHFREMYKRMGTLVNPEFNVNLKNLLIYDCGDIDENLDLEAAHECLKEKVKMILMKGGVPFLIGGGNDQSYPNAKALLQLWSNCLVINVDAHLDVRPKKMDKVHSGSPFRLLLQDEEFSGKFVEFAAQGSQCSIDHVRFLSDFPNTKIYWFLKDLRESKQEIPLIFSNLLSESESKTFVSFDIDSIQSSDCPGVSCPATVGLTSEEALRMCFEAGSNPNVALFDLSEFNPTIEAYRTGRLVVNMFYYFSMGIAKRKMK